MMSSFIVIIIVLGLAVISYAQEAVLRGTVSDEAGAVIDKVKVSLTDSNKKTFSTRTNDDGYYSLQVPAGNYVIEYGGVSGFLITRVQNFKLAPTKMTLDIVLDVDMESPTTVYSEFVCDKRNNCQYVSRKGNGTSKAKEILVQTINTNRSRGKSN